MRRKRVVLHMVCLAVLFLAGCTEQIDETIDQVQAPIEEATINEEEPVAEEEPATEMEPVIQEELERLGVETHLIFNFGPKEIQLEQQTVGRYVDGIAYFQLAEAAEQFGWELSEEPDLTLSKGGLQYRFTEGQVERILLEKPGAAYELQFPLVFGEAPMIAQYDMEKLFGLQSHWDPDAKTLSLTEWEWQLPDAIDSSAEGDKVIVKLTVNTKAGSGELLTETPQIRVAKEAGVAARWNSSGHGQDGRFVTESYRNVLIPDVDWRGAAWIFYQERPLARYPMKHQFDADTGVIQVMTGPWDDFALELPEQFYTTGREGMLVRGTTEDEWVAVQVERLEQDQFAVCFEDRMETEGTFEWNLTFEQPGIYRVQLVTGKDNVRANRTHFYYEKME